MAIEIVSFPMKNGGSFQFATLVITRGYGFSGKIIHKWAIFHGYVSHNQRVILVKIQLPSGKQT